MGQRQAPVGCRSGAAAPPPCSTGGVVARGWLAQSLGLALHSNQQPPAQRPFAVPFFGVEMLLYIFELY